MIDSRFRVAVIAIALAGIWAWPATAMARTSPALSPEAELAGCIRRVAGGRTWLEKTLWGLRDQEGGWNGA